MRSISKMLFCLVGLAAIGCDHSTAQKASEDRSQTPANSVASATKTADRFAYPVSQKLYLTAAKDKNDDWYNARDFGEADHLGEDWNKNSGGDTDCGEAVHAAANGEITYSGDAGAGWGNVVIVTHKMPDGKKLQTLYGHLNEILKPSGTVEFREKIGTVGNANGKYLCHLHFEMRDETSEFWDQVGPGYATDKTGFLDASDFINKFKK